MALYKWRIQATGMLDRSAAAVCDALHKLGHREAVHSMTGACYWIIPGEDRATSRAAALALLAKAGFPEYGASLRTFGAPMKEG
jgi:hypothetical protein